jgi:hypothetical protein
MGEGYALPGKPSAGVVVDVHLEVAPVLKGCGGLGLCVAIDIA